MTRIRCLRFSGLLAWLMTLAACTLPLPPEEDPAYLKMTDMDNRLAQVERQVDNQGLVTLLTKIESLEKDVRGLRNDVETMQHQVEQTNGRQRELYLDLDQRLQAMEQTGARAGGAPAAAAGAALAAGALAGTSGTDRDAYRAAFDLLKKGEYDQAAVALQGFMAAYPNSELIDNAQYWLAETRYVSQNYAEALTEFQALLKRFPDSSKRPDALLKIGFCNYELEHWDQSRAALTEVSQAHPETTAARLANQRLARLTSEGR